MSKSLDDRAAARWLCRLLYADPAAIDRVTWDQLSVSDWAAVRHQARRHGVAALLYRQFRSLGPHSWVPAEVADALRVDYLSYSGQSTRQFHYAGQVFSALRDAGVPVIALKGTHLGPAVYGNISLREMEDIDLLVRRSDLEAIPEVLATAGYTPQEAYWLEAELENHCHLPRFVCPGAPALEVHWDLLHPSHPVRVDLEGLWQRAQRISISGVEVLGLCPEDLLIHLSLHAALQHWFEVSIRSLCDIVELVRAIGDDMDWEQACERAVRWGAGRSLLLTVYLAADLFAVQMPPRAVRSLERIGDCSEALGWAKEQILGVRGETGVLSPQIVSVWTARRPIDKVRALLRIAFPSRRFLATKYPVAPTSPRIWLRYLSHWQDLAKRYSAPWTGASRGERTPEQDQERDRTAALSQWLLAE